MAVRGAGLLSMMAIVTVLLFGCLAGSCYARLYQGKPLRGWNSYDGFTCTVTEDEVKANAQILVQELYLYGYQYVTIDYEWFRPGTGEFSCCGRNPWQDLVVDKYGRLLPSPDRYPSAKGSEETGLPGFRPLASFVQDFYMQFGIHIMRGIPRIAVEKNMPILGSNYTAQDAADNKTDCGWCDDMVGVADNAAGQAYYDSLINLYASWGVDFIKMDCAYSPDYKSEILQISKSIKSLDRTMALSMSPTNRDSQFGVDMKDHVSMYRINGDVWDNWGNIMSAFETAPNFVGLVGHPSYPDLDMLPLGRLSVRGGHGPNRTTALTPAEQRTMMTLWALFRTPFFMGGDLRSLPGDNRTLELLSNRVLLSIQADSIGTAPKTPKAYRIEKTSVGTGAIEEVINIETCRVGDPHQQWGRVSAQSDGSLPNHATFGCLTVLNCSQSPNATIGAERCHVGSGCMDGTNQIWEVGRNGIIDTPMNQAVLTTTSATRLPCNVTAMARSANLSLLQHWKRNETDNSLHHIATGGCLTSTLIGARQTVKLVEADDVKVAAWGAWDSTDTDLKYAALFNLDDKETVKVSVTFQQLFIDTPVKTCDLVNAWTNEVVANQPDANAELAPHASALFTIDVKKCK